MNRIILLLFVAVVSVHLGCAFQCLVCTKGDESCDNVKKEHLQECTSVKGKIKSCIKVTVQGQTIRTCGVPDVNVDQCVSEGGVTACMCNKEFCNSALKGPNHFSGIVVVTTALGLWLL
ncbi:hypothetical protein RvY_07322 [Ramazzottius varieornatus]|uniref:Protein quiver n=1 Tax=Ramazzottius varieornatus TaxID=947166 RepID=A0A1D1V1P8_RAMVA|nr:hypothetical protein RvY_07322 [Ramazzottius varieornatus]